MALMRTRRYLLTPARCRLCAVARHRWPCLLALQFLVLIGALNLALLSLVILRGGTGGVGGQVDWHSDRRSAGAGGMDGGTGLGRQQRPPDGPGRASALGDQPSLRRPTANESIANSHPHALPRTERPTLDKSSNRTSRYPQWCTGRSNDSLPADISVEFMTGKKYFLTAVLLVRIYDYDLARLTTREMTQWLQYLSYAGVEHVYVYDAYLYANESQREKLDCFVRSGYVTYVDWSHKARPKYTIAGTQVSAYQDCLDRFGAQSAWQTAIDIDEYPFSTVDRWPGFLVRAVARLSHHGAKKVGEISMDNYLYLGKPLNSSLHPLLIDRLWRRSSKRSNALVKPVYRPTAVFAASVHHNSLRVTFVNRVAAAGVLRMNHYWGARLQDWGEDTPKILAMTTEDRGMEVAVRALQPCVRDCWRGCCL